MFKLEFHTRTSAFEAVHHEAGHVLRDVAEQVFGGETAGTIRDYEGNVIGQWSLAHAAAVSS